MTRHKRTKPRAERLIRELGEKGYTQTAAAREMGVSFEHLNRVIHGHRKSARLLEAIESLPAKEVAK